MTAAQQQNSQVYLLRSVPPDLIEALKALQGLALAGFVTLYRDYNSENPVVVASNQKFLDIVNKRSPEIIGCTYQEINGKDAGIKFRDADQEVNRQPLHLQRMSEDNTSVDVVKISIPAAEFSGDGFSKSFYIVGFFMVYGNGSRPQDLGAELCAGCNALEKISPRYPAIELCELPRISQGPRFTTQRPSASAPKTPSSNRITTAYKRVRSAVLFRHIGNRA